MAEPFFNRSLTSLLDQWATDISCPGLILYGARQTGKTRLVEKFSGRFTQHVRLDLNDPADIEIFRKSGSSIDFLDTLHFLKGKNPYRKNTLLLIDGSSRNLQVINLAEDIIKRQPGLKVIICSAMELHQVPKGFSKLYLHPFSFHEFLNAYGDPEAIEAFSEVPFPVRGFHKLLRLFHQYCLTGGMPAVVKKLVQMRSISALKPVYENILKEFFSDISETSFRQNKKDLLTITLQNAFMYAGTRIKFNAFGNAPFGSREMANTLRYLENCLLLSLNYPSLKVTPPLIPDKNKFPRLQMLDTGLVTYFSGIQRQLIQAIDLNSLFKGQVLRHAVGQELLSSITKHSNTLDFWIRDKAQSSAEVDYLIPYEDLIIPVVVKSGEPGRLRSLHQFIDEAPHSFAIRLYAGNVNIRKAETLRGKPYYLLSLPYFLACRIPEHLGGFIRYVSS